MRLRNTWQICGYTGDVGVWHGDTEQPVAVCAQCAINAVSALIADAINEQAHMDGFERILGQLQSNFWKATTARLLRRKSHPPAVNGCDQLYPPQDEG